MDEETEVPGVGLPFTDEWERTFDAVPDLILILDQQHCVVRANRAMARRLGLQPEDLVGRACFEVVHGTRTPPLFCPHSQLLHDGCEHCVEVHDEQFGGTFLVSVSPLRDAQGATVGSVHVARDISCQKRAETDARAAVSQREQFLAMLSHELRNPLGAILNAACVVKRVSSAAEPFNEALAVIERQAQQMSHLLDDLLDVSRVMQGKIEFHPGPVDLVHVLAHATKVVQPHCDQRNQRLHLHLDEGPLTVLGDETRLQQVAVNLLMNATKYTAVAGEIWFTARQQGDDVEIRVRDNGRGIAGDKIDSIFELFVQADESLDRQEGGMGIGLTLVRMLVEMHGGQVEVHSGGLGKGSEFVVRLPRQFESAGPPQTAKPVPAERNVTRILVVEDNADSRLMLRALLELDGHHVEVAEDGNQGLQTLESVDFDLALIDIGLPGLSGYDVVRRFRARPRTRRPCLVALTGYGRPSDRDAVLAAGFDEHLVKPCDPQELERILSERR